ncbi:hypothetical protein DIURU_004677 [Diutina rugosa]|uniref:Kinesin motor domain-containing protein n=1 Tax=Diutina rugosa TaxID=5481 RepID=A0A642UGD9_DIURU|nr:uncharacterized protein DIURU_004677 [Diutina rugosa]KAA8898393.1 hypothetical protein DIURU_004677 [Diutina rugosa]
MSHVQVVVRCRDRIPREVQAHQPRVVDTGSDTYDRREPHVTVAVPNTDPKTYALDGVFGGNASQQLVYDTVVRPLVSQFLSGTSVTVFTYGQTGTGKTYTMVGEHNSARVSDDVTEDLPRGAGIIPRVHQQIFQEMSADHTLECSFIELYNEQLGDLLAPDAQLRLLEENKRVTVKGSKPCYITSYRHATQVLNKGLDNRKTAATKLNDKSSRSHMIYTLELCRQVDENQFVRCKLNLCDLAGSENVQRSGATQSRAREAGTINKSLHALGRVISALASDSRAPKTMGHIPYRDSKLTRILQDSLGGATRTALIATVSPVRVDADETLSTLEYAAKAKHIKNTAEVGTSDAVLKRVVVHELQQQYAQLMAEFATTKAKQGVFLAPERYNEMVAQADTDKTTISELQRRVAYLEKQQQEYDEFRRYHRAQTKQWDAERQQLKQELDDAHDRIEHKNTELASVTNQWHQERQAVAELGTCFHSYASEATQMTQRALAALSGDYVPKVTAEFQQLQSQYQQLAKHTETLASGGSDAVAALHTMAKVVTAHRNNARTLTQAVVAATSEAPSSPKPVAIAPHMVQMQQRATKLFSQWWESSMAPMVRQQMEKCVSDTGDGWRAATTAYHHQVRQAAAQASSQFATEMTALSAQQASAEQSVSKWQQLSRTSAADGERRPQVAVPSADPVVDELNSVMAFLRESAPAPPPSSARSSARSSQTSTPVHPSRLRSPNRSLGWRASPQKVSPSKASPSRRRSSGVAPATTPLAPLTPSASTNGDARQLKRTQLPRIPSLIPDVNTKRRRTNPGGQSG